MLTIYTFTDNTRCTKSAGSLKPTKPILYYTKVYKESRAKDFTCHFIHFNHKDIEITEKHVKTLQLLNGQS